MVLLLTLPSSLKLPKTANASQYFCLWKSAASGSPASLSKLNDVLSNNHVGSHPTADEKTRIVAETLCQFFCSLFFGRFINFNSKFWNCACIICCVLVRRFTFFQKLFLSPNLVFYSTIFFQNKHLCREVFPKWIKAGIVEPRRTDCKICFLEIILNFCKL